MQVTRQDIDATTVKLAVEADQAKLESVKQHVLNHFKNSVKVPGFREGKAPAQLVEKHIDQSALQQQFLEHAVNDLYVDAVAQEKLRPVAQPNIEITKFVPFTTLEFTAEVATVGAVKLPDYTKLSLPLKTVTVTASDVNEVLENLRQRSAIKKDVTRAAKLGDEVVIDFSGVDAATKDPISGADGKDYPLLLGSGSFIPGFEEALVGLKPSAEKTFPLTFPADYGAKELQSKKVEFTVTVHKVQELTKPALDDAFAATVGSFKTVAELKTDIKKQLTAERQREATQAYDNELLQKIAEKTEVVIPDSLIAEEIERLEEEERRNLVYRGQTWEEHLKDEGVTAEEHRERNRPGAELRVKSGLILGEIAEKEKITVAPEELEIRIQLLKGQYPDAAMQAELDKPENRRDINSRLLTEKTLDKLRSYASK